MNEKISFPERIDRLDAASKALMDIASVLAEEVAHMQAAAKRFAENKRERTPKGKQARR